MTLPPDDILDPDVTQRLQTAETRATLSRELGEFLIELSIGVHRYAMYPPAHPSLAPVVDRILGRLASVFVERRTLSIGVAERQLVLDGVATDPKHPVLSDLAGRLHDHRLAAVVFREGTGSAEVEELLETLSLETERGAEPVGLRPREEIPSWPHVHLEAVGYEQLVLDDDDTSGESTADRLWLDLARSVLTREGGGEGGLDDPGQVARAIRERPDAEYDQVIARYLRATAKELREGSAREAGKVRRQVAGLIDELDEETLERLLSMGGDSIGGRDVVLDPNHALSVDAVVKVLRASARSAGQEVSNSLSRMLTKLAGHARTGSGTLQGHADTALRENVEELMRDWTLEDPNPRGYTTLLDSIARSSPVAEPEPAVGGASSASRRILDMSLEIDAYGPTVERAVDDLLESGEGMLLLERLSSVDETHGAGSRIQEHLSTPARLQRLLAGEDVHEEALRSLATRMGPEAIDPLLDVLTESDSRAVRRKVFDVLTTLGPAVSDRAVARLDDGRWYVVRNMLALLQRVGAVPRDFDPVQYTWYEDRRVRREALALAMRDEGPREWALAQALSDEDERLVRMALGELQHRIPETVVPVLVNRVARGKRPPELRALAAGALANSRSPLARECLLELASAGRSLFGRPEATPDVLEALSVLARVWSDHPDVEPVLEWARRSRDDAVRAAVAEVS